VDAAGADSDDGLPPLPRRRRQTHLVAQLRAGAAAPAVQPEEDSDRSPEQVRSAISAFQRGTRRARRLDQEAGAPGAE
jgi:hypothetical protein